MRDPETLLRRALVDIPLAQHLGVQLVDWDGAELRLAAPLAPNINDKGSFFAGSQSALLTLGGWLYVSLLAWPGSADVVAAASDVRFLAPVMEDAEIRVRAQDGAADLFLQRFARKGRAPLVLDATLRVPGAVAVATAFHGNYLATRRPD